MRVLVTGGAGFIGRHVAAAMSEAGHEPVIFDIRQPHLAFPFVAGDLTRLEDCERVLQGMEAVCHLGGVGDVYLAFERPQLAAAVNVLGTTNLLEAASRVGTRRVIYASTWEVYGTPQYQPIDEDHPCEPDHPYNITKLAGERMALAYDRLKGVQCIALRLGTAYGVGMRSNSVFSVFIERARTRQSLTIRGDGRQYRQFVHATDIARAFVAAVEAEVHGQAFNIVSSEVTSIRDLAELITGVYPTDIKYEVARVGDIHSAIISGERAQKLLGWRPRISVREGVLALAERAMEEQPSHAR